MLQFQDVRAPQPEIWSPMRVADEAREEADDRAERVAEERHEREGRADGDGAARDRDLGDEQDAVERRADRRVDDRPRGDLPELVAVHATEVMVASCNPSNHG